MKSYSIAYDSNKATAAEVKTLLEKMNIKIVQVLEAINTISIITDAKLIPKIKKQITAIISIEEEGEMTAI